MTVPHERTRVIGWGKEVLASIKADDAIPAALRARAHEIDPGYPTALALQDWLTAGKNGLPDPWTIDRIARGDEPIAGWLMTADRHR